MAAAGGAAAAAGAAAVAAAAGAAAVRCSGYLGQDYLGSKKEVKQKLRQSVCQWLQTEHIQTVYICQYLYCYYPASFCFSLSSLLPSLSHHH